MNHMNHPSLLTASANVPSQQQHHHHHQEQQSQQQPKKRTRVTPSQLTILEETFAISATPDSKMRKQLAQKLQMPERSIQIWFQNRRAKVKMLQKRAIMREEQEAAKARLYAEAAAYVHNHHHQPYWYPRRSHHQHPPFPPPPPAKVPIQRAWSSDVISSNNSTTSSAQHHSHPTPPTSSSSTTTTNTIPVTTSVATQHQIPTPHQQTNTYPPPAFAAPPLPPPPFTTATPPLPLYIVPNETMGYPDEMDDMRFRRIDSEPAPMIHDASLSLAGDASTIPESGLITASALTVGTWHRMKITQQDLLCHYHSTERTFAWHIRDSDYHFKMVVSFDTIASIEINTLPDNVSADIHLDLAEPPLFFMENGGDNNWIQCSDFTEGMQATCILRHTIRGLTADLRQELFNIASLDDGLCQVTQFFTTPNTTTPSAAIMAAAQAAGVASSSEPPSVFDQNLLWRHQSLPLGFGWTGDETSSSF